jgi:hypothetical protein
MSVFAPATKTIADLKSPKGLPVFGNLFQVDIKEKLSFMMQPTNLRVKFSRRQNC